MNAQTISEVQLTTRFVAPVLAAILGLTVILFSGFVQAQTLHDAAHDVRHTTGFPCH